MKLKEIIKSYNNLENKIGKIIVESIYNIIYKDGE
jgi:hypothetical protein|tara:strand:+ start:301 stop:405 length:105 start_codon:yes stop_codon:yes gene_type:complete